MTFTHFLWLKCPNNFCGHWLYQPNWIVAVHWLKKKKSNEMGRSIKYRDEPWRRLSIRCCPLDPDWSHKVLGRGPAAAAARWWPSPHPPEPDRCCLCLHRNTSYHPLSSAGNIMSPDFIMSSPAALPWKSYKAWACTWNKYKEHREDCQEHIWIIARIEIMKPF